MSFSLYFSFLAKPAKGAKKKFILFEVIPSANFAFFARNFHFISRKARKGRKEKIYFI